MLRILDDIAGVNVMSMEVAVKVIGPAMFSDIIEDYL